MTPHLYMLSGAPAGGKTTLLNSIAADHEAEADPELKAIRAPKYSDRPLRRPVATDDVSHVEKFDPKDYDVVYLLNGFKYGIKLDPVRDLLDRGFNGVVVVSDLRVVGQIKALLGDRAKAVYVSGVIDPDRFRRVQLERMGFRPTDEEKAALSHHFSRVAAAARLGSWDRVSECMDDLYGYWERSAKYIKSNNTRQDLIRTFHIRYIEHIALFDHVILNWSVGRPSDMVKQARALMTCVEDRSSPKKIDGSPVFVVAAPSGSGKGTLMEMLGLLGQDRIHVTSKLAKRSPKSRDKRDGMIALGGGADYPDWIWPEWWTPEMRNAGRGGEFPLEYDLRWTFHGGTGYAVSSVEIERAIAAGIPQILVSNMEQFEIFKTRWPGHVVFLYMDRLSSDSAKREYHLRVWQNDSEMAAVRIAEQEAIRQSYNKNIGAFSHVLLNTSHPEDLYDQMVRLLDAYSS